MSEPSRHGPASRRDDAIEHVTDVMELEREPRRLAQIDVRQRIARPRSKQVVGRDAVSRPTVRREEIAGAADQLVNPSQHAPAGGDGDVAVLSRHR
jgi:hypothetical protein